MTPTPPDPAALRRDRIRLFTASFLLLYFELLFIRWIPGQVRMIAYFANFVLMACFCGMGLGMILAKRNLDTTRFVGPALAGLMLVSFAIAPAHVMLRADSSVANLAEYLGEGLAVAAPLVVGLFFGVVAAAFVPLGEAIGRSFTGHQPLLEYSINLLGSLAGIVVFVIYGWLWLPAWMWFALGAPLLAILPRQRAWKGLTLATAALAVVLAVWADRGIAWSPYQKLMRQGLEVDHATGRLAPLGSSADATPLPQAMGFNITVNDDFYQHPLDLRDEAIAPWPILQMFRAMYDAPYQLRPNPDRVLIVGGGSGNDAAAALRNGATHVDVVEIDPRIVAFGVEGHPEQPYADPRVHVHIDDARHFFGTAEGKYDLIVFALIDSHRLLSARTSLRLDSYLYTVESFASARRLLHDDGLQMTAFTLKYDWQEERFGEMLRQAYGNDPARVESALQIDVPGVYFFSGTDAALGDLPRYTETMRDGIDLATDDWPFVYAKARGIPMDYLLSLVMIVSITGLAVSRATGRARAPNSHFFFLGAGFLLIESKNVTTLALIFGSTWAVNAAVFIGILVMALLANAVMSMRPIQPSVAYVGLFSAIAINAVVPLSTFGHHDLWFRVVVVGGLAALPIFFSGLVFAHSFARARDSAHALGSNTLGAICGGVLENASMATGLRFLFVIVALMYALSWVTAPSGDGEAAG